MESSFNDKSVSALAGSALFFAGFCLGFLTAACLFAVLAQYL